MPDRMVSDRIDPAFFWSHIVWAHPETNKLTVSLLKRDEEELDRLARTRWNYSVEREEACRQAKEKWYPYRAAEILEDFLLDSCESNEVSRILNDRWSAVQQEVSVEYFNGTIAPEINRALDRREMSRPKYPTDWGFKVKSQGEQAVANALRYYRLINDRTGEHRPISLLYEPLFRIPDENRIILPDFVIPDYCLILEYEGLEERSYKVGLWLKTDALRRLGFPIIVLRPEDLSDLETSLKQKLSFYFDLYRVE